jgi:hypothetical protein
MEFRLTYSGQLQPIGNKPRPEHVHAIRREFHKQLKNLWQVEPYLRSAIHSEKMTGRVVPNIKLEDYLATQYQQFGFNFLPLVTKKLRLLCSVDVLFLRPEPPGDLVQSGDLDGRIKTLFDALSMPQQKEQIHKTPPIEGESPFYCLLEDDKLISRVSVETDTMHEKISTQINKFDARLVVRVCLKPFDMGWDNINFS